MFKPDEKGSIMVYAVILITALALILGAVLTISLGRVQEQKRVSNRSQAYYMAESGINEAKHQLQNMLSDKLITFYPYTDDSSTPWIQSETQGFKTGNSFKVWCSSADIDQIRVRSKGVSGNSVRTIEATFHYYTAQGGGGGSSPQFDMAVFAIHRIDMGSKGSASINGNVGTNTTAPGGVHIPSAAHIDGNLSIGPGGIPSTVVDRPSNVTGTINNLLAIRTYSMPDFPSFPTLTNRGSLDIGYSGGSISDDGYYSTISIHNDGTLTINTGSTERIIRVGTLSLEQGSIALSGTGKLTIYVDTSLVITNGGAINNNGNISNVMIYYNGSNNISITGDKRIFGSLYSNSATADITISNSCVFNGCIISKGDNVTINGDGSVISQNGAVFAPNATVTVPNSGKLTGSIICYDYASSGSGLVTYSSGAGGTYPFGGTLQVEINKPTWREL